MARRPALLGLLALAALLGWVLFLERGRPPPPVAGSVAPHLADEPLPGAQLEGPGAREPAGRIPTVDAAADGAAAGELAFDVRSSIGLPLRRVELLGSAGVWSPVACAGGRVRARARAPLSVRAPGHAAGQLPAAGGSVVLEPDALLELDDPEGLLPRDAAPRPAGGDALDALDLAALACWG